MIIHRFATDRLVKEIQAGKVVILYGPRRVGKTTLLSRFLSETALRYKRVVGDNLMDVASFSVPDARALRGVVGDAELFVVDEAQKIPNIGVCLKIIVDESPRVAVVASGSASLDLAQHAEKELVGRNKNVTLYPVSFSELSGHFGAVEAMNLLERWLLWGGYPEAVLEENSQKRSKYLGTLVGSYLYRDMLELSGIRKPKIVTDLLQMLAFQIGQEVSWAELSNNLKVSVDTVVRYLDLLEKSFVIFNARGFSRNLRKEIYKNSRYYFWDNGVRNALINNFNPLNLRNDVGQLWENFLAVERLKRMGHLGETANTYFWRTYDKKEIDWIEERGGRIYGYEFRWSGGTIRRSVRDEFLRAYPGAQIELIGRENFEQFVT